MIVFRLGNNDNTLSAAPFLLCAQRVTNYIYNRICHHTQQFFRTKTQAKIATVIPGYFSSQFFVVPGRMVGFNNGHRSPVTKQELLRQYYNQATGVVGGTAIKPLDKTTSGSFHGVYIPTLARVSNHLITTVFKIIAIFFPDKPCPMQLILYLLITNFVLIKLLESLYKLQLGTTVNSTPLGN